MKRLPAERMWRGGLLLFVVLLGAGLRLAFMVVSHPHVDEYSTIWAAQQILQKGIPVLPSGFVYLQGVVFTYLDAAAIGLFGFSEWAARLPSLLCSVLTLPLLYWWGRRAFGPWAGIVAATLSALEASSIIWGGRARMYALQELWIVLALYAFYRGYVESPRSGPLTSSLSAQGGVDIRFLSSHGGGEEGREVRHDARWRWAFAVAFIGAVLAQTVTVLLAPALVLSLIVWKGRAQRKWKVGWPLACVLAGLSLALILNRVGGPVSETAGRSFVDPAWPWRLKPGVFFFEFFWTWPGAIRTVMFLAGFVWLAWTLWRRFDDERPDRALIYLLVCIAGPMFLMIFFVGESWQRPRYVMMLLPVMNLLVAGVLWQWVGYLRRRWPPAYRLNPFAWLVLLLAFAPAAASVIGPAEPAYDEAFHYVRANWQEGDAVIGPLPSISASYLGRCDGYALQNGYEEYLVPGDSQPVDRWTGAPLVDSAAALESRFPASRRVWFVIDDLRLNQRYDADFRDYVTARMIAAFRTDQVTAFLRPGESGGP